MSYDHLYITPAFDHRGDSQVIRSIPFGLTQPSFNRRYAVL